MGDLVVLMGARFGAGTAGDSSSDDGDIYGPLPGRRKFSPAGKMIMRKDLDLFMLRYKSLCTIGCIWSHARPYNLTLIHVDQAAFALDHRRAVNFRLNYYLLNLISFVIVRIASTLFAYCCMIRKLSCLFPSRVSLLVFT